jgi:hypothetical protein
VTKQEAVAVNVVLDLTFGTNFQPGKFAHSAALLAEHAHAKLGYGWNAAKVREATKR